MKDLLKRLPELLPLATAWAEAQSTHGARLGKPLNEAGVTLARRVGVAHPERIRIVVVKELPMPDDPVLRAAGLQAGLIGAQFSGLTLAYVIFVREGDERIELLAHECRHVAQYESFGSIGGFLATHLRDVIQVGYGDAPLEQDARAFESCVR